MSYSVIPTPDFKKLFKKLAKKYPSLKADLQQLLLQQLQLSEPTWGITFTKSAWPFPQKAEASLAELE